MNARTVFWLVAAIGFFGVAGLCGSDARGQTADPRVADLVQAGKIRVGVGVGNHASAVKDPATGALRGVATDLAQALAARIGVHLQIVEYPRPGAVLDGVRSDAWDATFLVVDPDRTAEADATPAYMASDFTYMVPAGSSIRHVGDVDRPGIHVAVSRGDAVDLRLSRVLQRAELVRADTQAAGVALLRSGRVNAYAAPRPSLMALSHDLPGTRVLDDGFAAIAWAGFVPKGHAGRLAFVSEFIEAAKASGLVRQFIARENLRGIKVAPPAIVAPGGGR
jgi:polar amino acid transport system substrate-binding protein